VGTPRDGAEFEAKYAAERNYGMLMRIFDDVLKKRR